MIVQEAEALQAEVKLLQAEASQLRRDNELRAEVETQCARRGAAQVPSVHSSQEFPVQGLSGHIYVKPAHERWRSMASSLRTKLCCGCLAKLPSHGAAEGFGPLLCTEASLPSRMNSFAGRCGGS